MANTEKLYPGEWINYDGLMVQFPGMGVRDAVIGKACVYGDDQELIVDLDWHTLPGICANEATGVIYGGEVAYLPAGALIKSAVATTTEAFVGAGTMSVGLVYRDAAGAVQELDNDGLLDAIVTTAWDSIGETVTGAGALVGTILAATWPSYLIWVSVQTAAYTAGKARLKITYFMPTTNTPGGVPV